MNEWKKVDIKSNQYVLAQQQDIYVHKKHTNFEISFIKIISMYGILKKRLVSHILIS